MIMCGQTIQMARITLLTYSVMEHVNTVPKCMYTEILSDHVTPNYDNVLLLYAAMQRHMLVHVILQLVKLVKCVYLICGQQMLPY